MSVMGRRLGEVEGVRKKLGELGKEENKRRESLALTSMLRCLLSLASRSVGVSICSAGR